MITALVTRYGTKKWTQLGTHLPGRTGKQCRERWHNHLDPGIVSGAWSLEEDLIIIDNHKNVGTKWSGIAKQLPGRADNAIKNHWNSTLRKVKRQEADPKKSASCRALRKGDSGVLYDYICGMLSGVVQPHTVRLSQPLPTPTKVVKKLHNLIPQLPVSPSQASTSSSGSDDSDDSGYASSDTDSPMSVMPVPPKLSQMQLNQLSFIVEGVDNCNLSASIRMMYMREDLCVA